MIDQKDAECIFVWKQMNYIKSQQSQQVNKIITTTRTTMRPLSQRFVSDSPKKLQFQTKLKSRMAANLELKDQSMSLDVSQLGQTHRSSHNHQFCLTQQNSFRETSSKLIGHNFQHHHNEECVCNQCKCGRHLCKLNVIKPNLTKNTIYQRSFYEQKLIPNIVNHDKEYDRLQGPHLDMNSTYHEGFRGKLGDALERPSPQDLIKRTGPCAQLSSYSSQFPGYRGDNQYVKPTDQHTRGYFPLRSKTTYAKEFVKKSQDADDYKYFPDQLRAKSNWFGRTTYEKFYNNPNPEYFAKKVRILQKLQENPNFNHQYQTTYRNDFIAKQSPICPSKVLLQTKIQGLYNDKKGKFSENTDFKAISPQFHAISTSKHSFV